MTLARISLYYLRRRALATALNVALLAFGIAAVTLLALASTQLERRMQRDADGIDLVIGAKGSQTQLILSTIYGIDAPSGTVRWSDAQEIAAHRGVAQAIPLALGDQYYGYRIVGTTHAYPALYGAVPVEGTLWNQPMEAVFGADAAARLRPRLGSTFVASHSVAGAEGAPHNDTPYRVVGVLGRTGTLLDRLVLTDVASYWKVHPEPPQAETGGLVAEPPPEGNRSVTALLIRYAVNHAAADVPYVVSQYSGLQAATPDLEATRLHGVVAVGIDLLRAFALILMLSAALSIFIALYNGLKDRRYDIAVMRTLGATRADVMSLLIFEGVMLAAAGALLGLVLGHLLTSALGFALERADQVPVSGWTWSFRELWIVALALAVGFLAALVPAWRAHEVDIAGTLARG